MKHIKRINEMVSVDKTKRFNIKNVYHVSNKDFEEFKKTNFDYFFFSNKPIDINSSVYTYICNLSMHKPFVFSEGNSWTYPLWLYLTDKNGDLIDEKDFTKVKYDGYLGCPFEFWKMVYYDEDEYITDELPVLVKRLNLGYDGVIIKDIQEGDNGDIVDDYIVFKKEQIQIVKKIKK